MDFDTVSAAHHAQFGRAAEVMARAPGRVNLIGEHVDYHEGHVLPIALSQATYVAVAPRSDRRAVVFSEFMGQLTEWDLDAPDAAALPPWARYIAGVAHLLTRREARLPGFDAYVASDVPVGAGLSSSAALSVAAVLALANLAGEPLESNETIDCARHAENEYAGVPCGIMDQSASLLARAGHALLLDCRTRQVEHVPIDATTVGFVLVDSGIRHDLADGAYGGRVRESQDALAYFRRLDPEIRTLRDVSSATVRAHLQQLEPSTGLRALHVAAECERTIAAADALRSGTPQALGKLVSDSHASLRDNYEVSCREVDRLVTQLSRVPGVLGARLTGGGFGGGVLVITAGGAESDVLRMMGSLAVGAAGRYQAWAVRAGSGAEMVHRKGR
jgi:galactokinase